MKKIEEMLMSKKSKGEMSPEAIQAKMDVLRELMDSCKAKLGDSVKSGMDEMQKVTVAAPDKEALALGLEKAKELTQGEEPSMLESLEELSETPKEEESEHKENLESSDEEDEDISMFAKKRK